ncbi:hypothetical protein AHAS_Ahas20G0156500 [Arachis hypogaea]
MNTSFGMHSSTAKCSCTLVFCLDSSLVIFALPQNFYAKYTNDLGSEVKFVDFAGQCFPMKL